jgi:ketosteroid isomerase-like protein
MKLRNMFPFFLVSLLAGSVIAAHGAQKEKAGEKRRGGMDFKALMVAEAKAIDTLDMANAASFHAKEHEDVFYDIAPLKYKGWSEFAEGAQKLLSQWQSMKCVLGDDLQTHQHGSSAWGAATWHCDIVHKGGAKEGMDGRWTVIWERRGKDWLVVHEHFSVPLPTPAETAK